jgi:hypothetical protein
MTHSDHTAPSQVNTSKVGGYPPWIKTADAAKLTGLSPSCLKSYRLVKKELIEGLHWVYTNPSRRTILYNSELLFDWVANRTHPEQHQRTLEAYVAAQTKGASRKSRKGQRP